MTDDSAADALNVQIDEAKAAGNDELAQRLYQKQQGTEDPYGLEPAPAPVVSDGGGDPPAQTRTGPLVVATGADDEAVTVTPGMDFAGNPESVAFALEEMSWWDRDERRRCRSRRRPSFPSRRDPDRPSPARLRHRQWVNARSRVR